MGSRGEDTKLNPRKSPVNPIFGKGRKRRGIAGYAIILSLVVVALLAVSRWAGSDEIYRGVEAGGVDLGGMTPEEARAAFAERTEGAPQEVKVDGPGEREFVIRNLGARFDAADTVERAYAVGREGWVGARFSARLDTAIGGVSVAPAIEYPPEKVRAAVERLAGQVNEPLHNASLGITGTDVRLDPASNGYELDTAATVNNIERAIQDMSGDADMAGKVLKPEVSTQEAEPAADRAREAVSGPVTLRGGTRQFTIAPAVISDGIVFTKEDGTIRAGLDRDAFAAYLSNLLAGFEVPPVNADYRFSGDEVVVVPGQNGKVVDKEKLLEEIQAGMFDGVHEYEIPGTASGVEPEFTTAEAEKVKPTTKLADYRTNYEIVPGDTTTRNENLRIASNGVTGTILAPGEVYSMNDQVSHLDYETAKVINEGKEEEIDGGGLCQVTSTLYNAANFAGLEILERYQHYSELPYIRPGMDATVWFGFGGGTELDMKFRNTTDDYIVLREYVSDDGYIYAEVWGQPTGIEVDMWTNYTFASKEQVGWVTYKTVRKNGKVIRDGRFGKTSVYEALTDIHGKKISPMDIRPAPVDP